MSYLDRILNNKEYMNNLNWLIRNIKKSKIDFDFIATSGLSGNAFGPFIAAKLNKKIGVIRKSKEKSHSNTAGIYYMDGKNNIDWHENKYIIIDDLIESGNTIRKMINYISTNMHKTNCVGIFLYGEQYDDYFINKLQNIPVFSRDS
jgi:adenine/guanine phosphoribosyltransferase-like PRPP-binding protein